MIAENVNVQDLVGCPFKRGGFDPETGIDCCGIASIAIERATGLVVPQDVWTPEVVEVDERWEWLGDSVMDARELGDVIVSDPYKLGCGSHVSTLVGPFAAITSHEEMGSFIVKTPLISNVLGACRWLG